MNHVPDRTRDQGPYYVQETMRTFRHGSLHARPEAKK